MCRARSYLGNKTLKVEAQSFAVFGGSFNPVHEGHLAIMDGLARLPGIRQVLVIPARRSPYKLGEQPLPDELRWRMLRRAVQDRPHVAVLDLELRRPPPSYTYETLAVLQTMLPRARLHLALGWDAFQGFAGWRHAGRIVEAAELLVFGRAGVDGDQTDPAGWAAYLPPPWSDDALAEGRDRLVTPQGHTIVRYVPLALPEISASRVLAERRAEDVPAVARPLLEAYWADVPREGG